MDARLKTASVSIGQRRLVKHLGFSNLCVLQMFMEDNLPGYIPASDVLTLLFFFFFFYESFAMAWVQK